MGVDVYPEAVQMMLPTYYSFSSNAQLAIVQHSTGGDMTVQDVYNTFKATMRSTHFAIGRDGTVAQFVPLSRGAGGNCCAQPGYFKPFWSDMVTKYGNLNLCTFSIEHCNDSKQSLEMTPEQMDASNKLTLWLCQNFNISTDHIQGHDSINATNCPGSEFYSTYWQQMIDYVNGGGVNKFMQQQMNDMWEAFLKGLGEAAAPDDTGIYASWSANYQKINAGSPMGGEVQTVDWKGNAIALQLFTSGLRCEFSHVDHTARWYDYTNKQVA